MRDPWASRKGLCPIYVHPATCRPNRIIWCSIERHAWRALWYCYLNFKQSQIIITPKTLTLKMTAEMLAGALGKLNNNYNYKTLIISHKCTCTYPVIFCRVRRAITATSSTSVWACNRNIRIQAYNADLVRFVASPGSIRTVSAYTYYRALAANSDEAVMSWYSYLYFCYRTPNCALRTAGPTEDILSAHPSNGNHIRMLLPLTESKGRDSSVACGSLRGLLNRLTLTDVRRTGNGLARSGTSLIEILFRHYPRRGEQNQRKKLIRIAGSPPRIPTGCLFNISGALWTKPTCLACCLWNRSKTKKVKAIPVTGRRGLYGCEMLRIPHCLDNRLTDGDKALRNGSALLPRNINFLLLVLIC
jgi:hypothetical protein